MNDYEPTDIQPTVHNAKDKYDVLDWENIPPYTCDMNYRLPSSHSPADFPQAVRAVIQTILVTIVLHMLLVVGPATFVAVHSSLLTIALVALLVAGRSLFPLVSLKDTAAGLASALAVFGVWAVLSLIARGNEPATALACVFLVGLPIIGGLADRIATHYVFWLSANPRIDRETMTSWRQDWQYRFAGVGDRPPCRGLSKAQTRRYQRAMRLRRFYPWGFAILGLSLLVAIVLGMIQARFGMRDRLATLIGLQMAVILLSVSVGYCVLFPNAPRLFIRAWGSFYGYGKNAADPPWVFQSPVGRQPARRAMLIAATGFLTILTSSLTMSQGLHMDMPISPRSVAVRFCVIIVVIPLVVTTVLLLVGSFVAIAPALVGHHDALEADEAPEQHSDWSVFDGYIERLQNSRNSIERRSNLIGFHSIWGFPILADTDLYFEHQHILGGTGVAKTALSVITDSVQLIRRNDGPVIIVDCKGDRVLFRTVLSECEAMNRVIKWFTNRPFRSTYIFNPLAHLNNPQFTLPEILGVLLQSLNLYHGDEYGRAYFGKAVRILLRAAYLATMPNTANRRGFDPHATFHRTERIESFWDLDDILQELASSRTEYEAAKHLGMLVQSLCDFDQLNLTAARDPNEPAVQHAISMPEVIEKKQVVYFHLVGTMDAASVGEIARLALFATNAAAVQYHDRTNQRPRVYFIADEAQCLVAKNVETVLQQARDSGLAFLLAHQSLSQLSLPGGPDLAQQVTNSTCIKRYHSARDPASQRYIAEISGTTKYYQRGWKQFKHRVHGGEVSSLYACPDPDGVKRIDVSEHLGYRLEPEDIRDVNRDINKSIVMFERNSGYSQFRGAFPMTGQWPMSYDEYHARSRVPWPDGDDETITIGGAWPQGNEETIVPTTHPGVDMTVDPAKLDESLRKMHRLLSSDEE